MYSPSLVWMRLLIARVSTARARRYLIRESMNGWKLNVEPRYLKEELEEPTKCGTTRLCDRLFRGVAAENTIGGRSLHLTISRAVRETGAIALRATYSTTYRNQLVVGIQKIAQYHAQRGDSSPSLAPDTLRGGLWCALQSPLRANLGRSGRDVVLPRSVPLLGLHVSDLVPGVVLQGPVLGLVQDR